MFNLAEYARRPTELADYLPWAALVAPGVILNKDGSFQRTLRFRGPDLESATDSELLVAAARLNNALKRLGSGWALYVEAARRPALAYPDSVFPDPLSALVDAERRAAFLGDAGASQAPGVDALGEQAARSGPARRRDAVDGAARRPGTSAHHESAYHLTLAWMPPAEGKARAQALLVEGTDSRTPGAIDWREQLRQFQSTAERIALLVEALMPEAAWLDDAETLTFLQGLVAPDLAPGARIAVPETPAYLDALLGGADLTGGLAPMLGHHHLKILTIRGFPAATWPGLLDDLGALNFPYRRTTRFLCLDRDEAETALTKLRRQWFAKRKGVATLLRELIYSQEAPLVDNDAANKAADADGALQLLGTDMVAFGYMTATLVVSDPDERVAAERSRAAERIVQSRGFVTVAESLNAVEAWLSSLPGHAYANVRQPLISSLNLIHMLPVSAVWAGPARNDHLDGPPLLVTRTDGATPFRFSAHDGDVGHMLVVGPTGAGKSVLLALLALQWRRYRHARIILFDKGGSARATILGMGGAHVDLGVDPGVDADGADGGAARDHGGDQSEDRSDRRRDRDEKIGASADAGRRTNAVARGAAFQPLRDIDREAERIWAADWIVGLLAHEGVAIDPPVREAIWTALGALASAAPSERTMTGLVALLSSAALRQALGAYTLAGPHGRLLDAEAEHLADNDIVCFEMEALMHSRSALLPVLTYLFHRLEARFDGSPTLLVLDEAWVFLDDPLFAGRIREWLKVLRKKNVAVVFATQSLADIQASAISPALVESCPTRIFLANPQATEPQLEAIYRAFGLNDRQIAIIASATPKRDYYLQSRRGNRLLTSISGR